AHRRSRQWGQVCCKSSPPPSLPTGTWVAIKSRRPFGTRGDPAVRKRPMSQWRDDRGKTLHLPGPPQRIVSLVPSDTYSLLRLGVRDGLIGRTRFCVAPGDEVEGIELVGGTKDPDVDRIVELRPDLVVANQEENARPSITQLEEAGLPVLVSFPRTV